MSWSPGKQSQASRLQTISDLLSKATDIQIQRLNETLTRLQSVVEAKQKTPKVVHRRAMGTEANTESST